MKSSGSKTLPADHAVACRGPRGDDSRRGVLLLVVLSMLTLFLMLGVAYLVTATRARESARAFARLTFAGDEARVPHARMLDAVLLRVVRGGTVGWAPSAAGGSAPAINFESLLGDKYGVASGTGFATTAFSGVGGAVAVLSGTVTLPEVSLRPTDLVGRLITFSSPGRPVTTHRIIRAVGSGNQPGTQFGITIDGRRGATPFATPLAGARVVVNGREFAGTLATSSTTPPSNESWDGFDFHNPFLAQLTPGGLISTSTVGRISYAGALVSGTLVPFSGSQLLAVLSTGTWISDYDGDLIPDIADNDNDGTPDGLFIDFGLPDSTDASGNSVQLRASVLICDLDGRFNVNAHDGLARTLYSGTVNWTLVASGTTINTGSTPIGSGYGPAEVNGAFMFVNAPPNAALTGTNVSGTFSPFTENPSLFCLTGGTMTIGTRSGIFGSRYTNLQPTPRLIGLEGKYGEQRPAPSGLHGWGSVSGTTFVPTISARFARPGQPAFDDVASRMSDRRISGTAVGTNDSLSYGVPSLWWTGVNGFNWAVSPTISSTSQPLPRGVFNSPPDLHGRMRTTTGTTPGFVPQMRFAKVEWANANSGTLSIQEGLDDPYELRLDTRLGFGGLLCDPSTGGSGTNAASNFRDNPFTPAEIEPVLRPYDIDTNRLPPRLAAMLGSAAEESRLKVTTDSWDTTAITGSAALVIFGTAGGSSGWLQTDSAITGANAVSGVIGGEVARGERFDLNRPLASSGTTVDTFAYPSSLSALTSGTYHLQRQAYFKDLYTLLVALNPSVPAATLAQWTANVVEFRDADSRIIPYEYDANPADGWAPDGYVGTDEAGDRKVVWGAERPEVVIQEAFAWRNGNATPGTSGTAGMVITLHRPWNARAYTGTSGTVWIDAEPCDVLLDTLGTNISGTVTPLGTGTALNIVDLGKQSGTNQSTMFSGTNASSFPIWRLRIVGSTTTTILRLDTSGTWASNEVGIPSVISGATKPRLPVDSTLSISTTNGIAVGPNPSTGTATLTVSGSNRLAPLLTPPGPVNTPITVYLERLSDPSQTVNTTATIPGTSTTGTLPWTENPLSTPDVATVPVRYIVIDSATATVVDTSVVTPTVMTARRNTINPTATFWTSALSSNLTSISVGSNLSLPTVQNQASTAWLPWPNRPFASAAELLLVPQGNSLEILQNYQRLTPALSGSVGLGRGVPASLATLFDAVHVPSRFAGIHGTTTNAAALGTAVVSPIATPVNQVSSFREPGRVNLNTVTAVDVWNAVVAGPLPAPVATATAAGFALTATSTTGPQPIPMPAASLFQLLTMSPSGTTVVSDTTTTALVSGTINVVPQSTAVLSFDRNPLHEIYTATRLANTVTPRSNVFAVWVTLRESVPNDPDSVRYRRAFYIVDRSIPVAFEPGVDHNVWDCVRLRRIIE